MPVLRSAAGPGGAHLPTGERLPTLSGQLPAPSGQPPSGRPPSGQPVVEALTRGEIEVLGRLSGASNTTLYATATLDDVTVGCVYKPISGERPLWDFPTGTLGLREVAAYRLAAAAGWPVIPPTVLRDGPLGPGSMQLWVDAAEKPDPAEPCSGPPGAGLVDVVPPGEVPAGWRSVVDARGRRGERLVLTHADHPSLRLLALLDILANNTDRKGGHVVADAGGLVFGIDHGLTFNEEDKLRTVLWGWAGERLSEPEQSGLDAVLAGLSGGPLQAELADLLAPGEVDCTQRRAADLARRRRFPAPGDDWPAFPWPAF